MAAVAPATTSHSVVLSWDRSTSTVLGSFVSQFEAQRTVRKDEFFCRLQYIIFRFHRGERPGLLLLRGHRGGFEQDRKLLLEPSLSDNSYELNALSSFEIHRRTIQAPSVGSSLLLPGRASYTKRVVVSLRTWLSKHRSIGVEKSSFDSATEDAVRRLWDSLLTTPAMLIGPGIFDPPQGLVSGKI